MEGGGKCAVGMRLEVLVGCDGRATGGRTVKRPKRAKREDEKIRELNRKRLR